MDKLTKARARLILKHPFWGALLLHLEPVEAPGLGTCGTDGHTLYYDQEQLDKWTDDEVMGVIAHLVKILIVKLIKSPLNIERLLISNLL